MRTLPTPRDTSTNVFPTHRVGVREVVLTFVIGVRARLVGTEKISVNIGKLILHPQILTDLG